jgi:hypothetical protein
MCLIIHQPEGATTPVALLQSAAEYNPDGFGFMGFDAHGKPRIERSGFADVELTPSLPSSSPGAIARSTSGGARAAPRTPKTCIRSSSATGCT